MLSTSQNPPTSANSDEIAFFNNLCSEWWDLNGGLSVLHSLNDIIVPYVQESICNAGLLKKDDSNPSMSLNNTLILEVGCGGGILTEPLARTGATVVGVDMAPDLINVAKQHAMLDSSLANLTYILESVEEHGINNSEKYDVVIASGVLEHVNDPNLFLEACAKCLKPGGLIFISTFNKTTIAWLSSIIVMEYILRYIPVGTHDWNKFVSPEDVQRALETSKCKTTDVRGVFFNLLTNKCFWIRSTSIFYILQAVKRGVNNS